MDRRTHPTAGLRIRTAPRKCHQPGGWFRSRGTAANGLRRTAAALPLSVALALGGCSAQKASVEAPEIAPDVGTEQAQTNPVAAPTADTNRNRPNRKLEHRATFANQHAQQPALIRGVAPQLESERYPEFIDNGISLVSTRPVSTFSVDVDTAAYANTRRQLNAGQLPDTEAVRVEEFINYFNYNYPQPQNDQPFSITTEVGPSPWNADRRLLLVGLQGYERTLDELPAANLVFLIDVSGSMRNPNKLGLLKSSMKMLASTLRPQDTISIAVYAGAAGTVLEPTSGREQRRISRAIDELHAAGSTNGAAGIELAYSLAESAFISDGINRVLLATDGDFNVGTKSTMALGELIENKRRSGVALSVLGFGTGNYNDALMQELAQKGNGNAAYIDTIHEARKVLVDELGATLETIAKDVKIQVEFNPATVREYRLIGYETRTLAREDFNNDRVDAGEIGAGHSVTALYELTLTDANRPSIDDLRYADQAPDAVRPKTTTAAEDARAAELAHVKLRFKAPQGNRSQLVSRVVRRRDSQPRLDMTSDAFRFAACVSGFGQLLRNSPYLAGYDYTDLLPLARSARGQDLHGYRSEFEKLIRTAAELTPVTPVRDPISAR